MNNKIVRIALLCFQIVISLVIFIVLVIGIAGGESMAGMVRLSIPCSIQTIANLAFSIVLYMNYKRTSLLDIQIAPVLLLSTSLENVRIFSYYAQFSYHEPVSQSLIAPLFFFSLILSAVMFCGLSVIPQSRSLISVNNYIGVGVIASAMLLLFGPRIKDLEHLESISIYILLVWLLYGVAMISFIISIIQNPHRGNILKQLSQMALVAGDFLLSTMDAVGLIYAGICIYLAGEILLSVMLLSKSRSYDETDITEEADQASSEPEDF